MKRIFIALELSVELSERLVRFQEALKNANEDERIVLTKPEHIHSTLIYMGEIDPAILPRISEGLHKLAASLFPFEVGIQGIGVFPNVENPRVLWAGFDEKSKEVVELIKRAIEKELEELGFESESKPYIPHVSLGRFASKTTTGIQTFVEEMKSHTFGSSPIRELIIFESYQDTKAFDHSVVERIRLG